LLLGTLQTDSTRFESIHWSLALAVDNLFEVPSEDTIALRQEPLTVISRARQ
jgi:hypothetical protein